MKDIRFSFCSFQENLINKVLSEQPVDEAVFVFPTEVSKGIARSEFQKHWAFNKTLFLSMEEMKELLFVSDKPLLKEEKRTLAFYASLTEKDREFFKINNYFQSIELAQHFFDLWEEFNDELVNENINKERFETYNAELLGWQKNTFDKLKSIKNNYQNFLKRKGLEDVVFLYKPGQLNFQYFSEFSRFVIVNQFYYTNLEKYIIQKIAELGNSVTIYYQLPETIVDKINLKIFSFTLTIVISIIFNGNGCISRYRIKIHCRRND